MSRKKIKIKYLLGDELTKIGFNDTSRQFFITGIIKPCRDRNWDKKTNFKTPVPNNTKQTMYEVSSKLPYSDMSVCTFTMDRYMLEDIFTLKAPLSEILKRIKDTIE